VGFRYFVQRAASELGITGYVHNLPDGRVEVYAVAEESVLSELRGRLEIGPPAARVDRVEERGAAIRRHRNFSIESIQG